MAGRGQTSGGGRTTGLARRLVTSFGPDVWRERRTLALAYLCTALSVGGLVLMPWPLKVIIDDVLTGHPVAGLLSGVVPERLVLLLAVVAVGIAVTRAQLGAWERRLNARVRERLVLVIRDRMLAHLQSLPPACRHDYHSGELVLRLVDDVRFLVRLLDTNCPLAARYLATTVATLGVMFWLEPRLAAVGVVVVLVIQRLARHYAPALQQASRDKRLREGEVAGLAQEIVRALPTTQALGHEDHTRDRFRDLNRYSLRAGVAQEQAGVAMERALQVAKAVAVATITGVGGVLVLRQIITLGELTVCIAYMQQLLQPVEKVNQLAASASRSLVRAERLLHLLDRQPPPERGDIRLDRARGLVEVSGLSFAHPNGGGLVAPLFTDLDLHLAPATLTALVGASGSGKSTLLGLLLRLYEPTAGEIHLDGLPTSRIELSSLRRQFAVMVQEAHLFAGSLRDAVSPEGRHDDATLWDALAQVALDDWAASLPGGLDNRLEEGGANLSGGQRARLSLARALLLDRPILLLDEPTANIDEASRAVILATLDRLRRERTCLVVTHDLELASHADVVVRLDGGRLVAPGAPAARGAGHHDFPQEVAP